MTRTLFLALLCLAPVAPAAAEEPSPKAVAQAFYDGYMKVLLKEGDSVVYVMKSEHVTKAFKKAYKAFMENPESDPIICGQDYPDAGFAAGKVKIEGDGNEATVVLTSRDPKFENSFEVYLKLTDKSWLIEGTKDLLPRS